MTKDKARMRTRLTINCDARPEVLIQSNSDG